MGFLFSRIERPQQEGASSHRWRYRDARVIHSDHWVWDLAEGSGQRRVSNAGRSFCQFTNERASIGNIYDYAGLTPALMGDPCMTPARLTGEPQRDSKTRIRFLDRPGFIAESN